MQFFLGFVVFINVLCRRKNDISTINYTFFLGNRIIIPFKIIPFRFTYRCNKLTIIR